MMTARANGRYKVVLFDFDGTLADTFPWFAAHVTEASERYKFRSVEPADVPLLRKKSAREVIQLLGIPFWKVPLIARFLKRAMTLDVNRLRLFAGVDEMLREVQGRAVELAIVSSNSEANVRAVLGPALAALVSHYECGAALYGKTRRLRRVLKRTGVPVRDAIYVGDEIRDYQAAQDAGIEFGAVLWGYTEPDALGALGPAALFQRVEEITTWILGAGDQVITGPSVPTVER